MTSHLGPLLILALHLDTADGAEELLSRDVLGQPREELSVVDEVHPGQDVLVKPEDAQRRTEQELVAVPAEHVPHATREVQGEGLTVQGKDPEQRQSLVTTRAEYWTTQRALEGGS